MNKSAYLLAVMAILLLGRLGYGMAEEQVGPDKPDRPTISQPGWASGIEMPPRHPSRVYSIWVNGNENFYFNATPSQINELVELFSKVRLRDHQVKLELAKSSVSSFDKQSIEYNVKLELLSGIALLVMKDEDEQNNQTLEPNLTIYLDQNGSLLKQLKFPENVIVTAKGDLPDLKVKRSLPDRKAYYGRIQLGDADAGNGIKKGVSTRITFWEKDAAEGIQLALANQEGFFKVILSETELAALNQGDAWLTTTTGNYSATAKKDGSKFPVAMLNLDKAKAQPQQLPAPKYYYGRVLFEDGTPAVLDKKPWPGAEISLTFPYAGKADLDADGYFQLSLEPEQFDELLKKIPRKNVYIPDQEQNRSTALEVFPPNSLSQDKSKAGEIKIKKPVYGETR